MYSISLTHLLHTQEVNNPGLLQLFTVPKAGINAMPDLMELMETPGTVNGADFELSDITLKAGYSWSTFSFDYNVVMELFEEENPKGSKRFLYELGFAIPNDDFETRGKIIRAYDNIEHIVLVKQQTNAWRLLGSKERGCVFAATLQSGSAFRGPNAFTCGLSWEVAGRRAFYIK